jgi:hypothetical protein
VLDIQERCEDRYLSMEEVRILEITINAKQMLALIWTVIAIVLSLIVVLAMGVLTPSFGFSVTPWWLLIAAFFGVFLVITLPVYLLIALWGISARNDNE